MPEPESVAAVWKIAAYALGATVLALASTIVAMAKYFAKERAKIAKQYKSLMIALNKSLNRIGDYQRAIYKRDLNADVDVTAFDFTIDNGDTFNGDDD
ncbi:hypothetical protein ACFL3R_00655 [Thermodesulfobacteriota bacterium]